MHKKPKTMTESATKIRGNGNGFRLGVSNPHLTEKKRRKIGVGEAKGTQNVFLLIMDPN